MIFAAMVSFLTACRIITIQQATAGFASSGLLTVVALYVVAEGISQTGGGPHIQEGLKQAQQSITRIEEDGLEM